MVLDFCTRLSRQQQITRSTCCLPFTQAHIAAYLGLTVAHVNRVLRSLRDEQIVSLERHCMTILDLNRLNTLAQKGVQPGAGLDERVLNRADARTEGQLPNNGGF